MEGLVSSTLPCWQQQHWRTDTDWMGPRGGVDGYSTTTQYLAIFFGVATLCPCPCYSTHLHRYPCSVSVSVERLRSFQLESIMLSNLHKWFAYQCLSAYQPQQRSRVTLGRGGHRGRKPTAVESVTLME